MKATQTYIYNDEVCIYVSTSANNPLWAKAVLLLADLLIVFIISFALIEWIPGLLLLNMVILFFLSRYTLWNIYGKEYLIISAKSFSYQHDYGFFRTNNTTKSINKLALKVTAIKQDGDEKWLRLLFHSYDSLNLPVEIYSMSFYIPQHEIEHLNILINNTFLDEMSERYSLPTINLN